MGEVRSVKAVRAGEQYEFSGRQNVPIRDLASKMRFVGVCLVVLGVLSCALVLIQGLYGIQGLIWGAINIATGLWTQRAARAFQEIVETEGSDISHLMEALRNLRTLYRLQFFLIITGICLLVATLSFLFMSSR